MGHTLGVPHLLCEYHKFIILDRELVRRLEHLVGVERLIELFFAQQALLEHDVINRAIGFKKPDASDTLYTLIRRLRPIVEQSGRLKIVTDRENGYSLQETCNGLLSNILQFITRRSR